MFMYSPLLISSCTISIVGSYMPYSIANGLPEGTKAVTVAPATP
uniref:Lipoprotein n=1 Tax=Acinetobacter phage vB_Ab_1137_KEN_05 TaxID=3143020 RepID=A0AAU8KVZ3_9VIRU